VTQNPAADGAPDGDGEDTIERFAGDLRELRRAAGNPTLAALDRKSGVSKSVLSDAFNGRTLPTERTVQALARALDADPGAWVARRSALDPSTRVPRTVPQVAAGPATVRRSTAVVLVVVCSLLASAVTFAGAWAAWRPAPADADAPAHVVATGSDPAGTPCVEDAVVVASESRERDTQLQIVYSEACHAAWARITRYDDAAAGNTVSASIYRQIAPDADDRQDTTEPDAQSAYTTLLVRETPQTRLCAVGSITVDGERIDLGDPVCL
jgi:transcriptional regulator with XRE-family HTH domain